MEGTEPESHRELSGAQDFRVGGHRVEPSSLRVLKDDRVIRLEPKSMQLLLYLAEHAGEVISRAQLEEKIWEGRIVGEDALTNSIAKLRRAFADNARRPRVIETLHKTGYRLIADVEWLDGEPAKPESSNATPRWTLFRSGFAPALLVLMLLVVIAAWWTSSRQPESGQEEPLPLVGIDDKLSVAVLPFRNLGERPRQDYFANGITTNLITDLSRVSALRVIAAGSVFSYGDASSGTEEISRDLDVDYVVIGSVQRQGELVRVNTQLIEADSERAIWGQRYESNMNDMFKLQDKVALALVNALNVELTSGESDSFSSFPTSSGEAYDLFLQGMEEYGHRTFESNSSAQIFFEQAVELDPEFARAIAGLALAHSRNAIDGWTETPDHSLERAAHYADMATGINSSIPQVHFVAGQIALFRGRHAEAVAAIRRAIEYSPNYADAYGLLAWILTYDDRLNEAEAALQTASRLNPVIPSSYSEILGEIRFLQGRYDEAIAEFERALQINPTHMRARLWLIAAHVESGSLDEAQWQREMLTLEIPEFSLQRLRYAFPFQDEAVRDRVLQGLSGAGLPD